MLNIVRKWKNTKETLVKDSKMKRRKIIHRPSINYLDTQEGLSAFCSFVSSLARMGFEIKDILDESRTYLFVHSGSGKLKLTREQIIQLHGKKQESDDYLLFFIRNILHYLIDGLSIEWNKYTLEEIKRLIEVVS